MYKNKIIFNTWSGAFFHLGGGEVQLLNSKKELESLGYVIEEYNQWNPQLDKDAIYHQFSTEAGTEHVLFNYKKLGLKVVLSPITWNLFPKKSERFETVRKMFHAADLLMTNSVAESQRLAEHFEVSIEKFHETRNSVSSEYFDLKTNKNFRDSFEIEGDFVLSLANIDRRKNTKMLVQACIDLDLQLISIGAVRDEEYFKSVPKSNVRFLGPIFDIDLLKSAYQQCSLLALPSLCETPGISALEALSQGANIAITKEGAAIEYFGEYAHYVDPMSLDSIKNGIIQGLRPSTLSKKAKADFIGNKYTWAHTAKEILEGYQKINR